MRNIRSVGAALSLSLAAALSACAPSLSGPKLDSDPNTPSSATPNQLLSSVQANGNILLNGPAARLVTMWVQQMSGTDRQYQSLGIYQGLTESNYDVPWQAVYTGGGLVDIRNIQDAAKAAADKTYLGIADRAGTIAAGKQADLVLIGGDPSATIGDIRKVETVFKQGVGYDPQKLVNSVKGKVGIF